MAGLVAQGLTNRQIAGRLFISERTVDGHLEHVREKLGVNTRAQIAAWVASQGTGSTMAVPVPALRQPPPVRSKIARPRAFVAIALVVAVGLSVVAAKHLSSPVATRSGPLISTFAGAESLEADDEQDGIDPDGRRTKSLADKPVIAVGT